MHRRQIPILTVALALLFLPSAHAQHFSKRSPSVPLDPAARQAAEKLEQSQFANLATNYRAWLTEDVVYIIAPEERRGFLHLHSDEEKEQFIEAFWARRNPDPDSNENLYEQEHYRRIAYANEFFSVSIPGWKTDRGRSFIEWGPPDQTDSTKNSSECSPAPTLPQPGAPLREVWHYRYLEGVGENVTLEFPAAAQRGADPPAGAPSPLSPTFCVSGSKVLGLTIPPDPDLLATTNSTARAPKTELFVGIASSPRVKNKDLEAAVVSRLERSQIPLRFSLDTVRVTSFTSIALLRIAVPEKAFADQSNGKAKTPQVVMYGRLTNMITGRIEKSFEATATIEPPASASNGMRWVDIDKQQFAMRAGVYEFGLAVKNDANQTFGTLRTVISVPAYGIGFGASSPIVAETVAPSRPYPDPVPNIRANAAREFTTGSEPSIFWQLYGVAADADSGANNVTILSALYSQGRVIRSKTYESADLRQHGEQITLVDGLAGSQLPTGVYEVKLTAYDHATGTTISRVVDFAMVDSQ